MNNCVDSSFSLYGDYNSENLTLKGWRRSIKRKEIMTYPVLEVNDFIYKVTFKWLV